MGMFARLGVSTAPLFPRPLAEMFSILREQPLREVELMPQSPAECQPEFAGDLTRHSGPEFHVRSIHFPLILQAFLYNPYPSAREYGRYLCEGVAALARQLRSHLIVVHPPPRNMAGPAFLEAAVASIRYLCDLCAGAGIEVGLENSPSSPFVAPEQLRRWGDSIARPNLAYVLDVTHAHQANLDPVEYVEALHPLKHLHVSDYHPERGPHQPIGRGQVDWSRLTEALCRKSFQGGVILELATSTVGQEPTRTLAESVARLQAWFGFG